MASPEKAWPALPLTEAEETQGWVELSGLPRYCSRPDLADPCRLLTSLVVSTVETTQTQEHDFASYLLPESAGFAGNMSEA